MDERRPPVTEEELVRAFANLFNEVEPETPEEINATLRDAGYDPDTVAARMKAVAERAIMDSPLNWRNRAKQELEEERHRRGVAESSAPQSRKDIINAIRRLLTQIHGNQVELATHFRNFDQATNDDLVSLLGDLEYLAAQQHKRPGEGGN